MLVSILIIVFFCLRFLSLILIIMDKKLTVAKKKSKFTIAFLKILASICAFKISSLLSIYFKNLSKKL
jgi:hypothetical protein